ncbi:MAG: alpha/beta hydrolase [Pseudomonadota bacterium]
MSPPTPPRTIVFSHANSFPASTYQPLFDGWRAAGYEVRAIEKFGHDPRYPVSTDWPHLVRQLKDFLEQEVGHPAYLIGHSLGGYLSMMVASRYPDLAQGLIVLDSPVLYGWRSWSVGLVKTLGSMDRLVPSGVAAQRCHEWPNLAAVREHFQAKPKFAAFHPGVLDAYVQHGTEHHLQSERRLSFNRDVESQIYSSMPHALMREFQDHPPTCPMAFIGGTRSKEVRKVGMGGIRRLMGTHLSWIEGSHLYPLEKPQATVTEVLAWLQSFDTAAAA